MPTKDPNNIDLLKVTAFMLIGTFAGLAKYASGILKGDHHFHWGMTVSQMIVSSFSGLVGGWIFGTLDLAQDLIYAGVGLSGFFGSVALNLFWNAFTTKAGVKPNDKPSA